MDSEKKIYVYENWKSETPTLIGIIFVNIGRGKEVVSFSYDDNWLNNNINHITIDPQLSLVRGRQYVAADRVLFGAFENSCPDRWGRLLMKRREAILAKKENRKPKSLGETDYLIGVYDETRMGGLRFSLSERGDFIANDKEFATPPWTTLRELEAASYAFERNEDGLEEKWLKQLMAPGSSLGGARPKATVLAPDGSLWIAKFPSKYDEINVGAWEMVAHELAKMCNINVPEAQLAKFSKYGSTYLSKRFDREGTKRIHFSSAMTLLGKQDGVDSSEGVSYYDIASIIKAYSPTPQADLHELWRRIVFYMAVSNTDDHLRNHGFLLVNNGWKLSPMYDVNPNIYGDTLSINVDSDSNMIDFNLALSVSKMYGFSDRQAREEIKVITNIVKSNWRQLAKKNGLGRYEIENMAPAFAYNELSDGTWE